jgi:hypothetical protein
MNIKNNPPRRSALVWTGIMIFGIIIIFLPAIIGLDGFDGGFAMSFLGGFVALMGVIASVIYYRLAGILDRITREDNLLAHWKYTPREWKQYTEEEHKEDASAKKGVFLLISGIAIVVGIIFYAVVRDNFAVIGLTILGIIAIAGLSAYFSALATYHQNKKYLGEAYISLDGVYLNRQVHIWRGLGNRLEDIDLEWEEQSLPRIRFEYSSPGRGDRYQYTARIPIPPGQEDAAKRIVTDIAAAHLVKSR